MSVGNNGVRVCDSGNFGHNSTDRIKMIKHLHLHTINDKIRMIMHNYVTGGYFGKIKKVCL